jgi:radical SAM-linked protein
MRGDSGFPVRIRFAKHGKVRFISHRDVARAFERAFRVEQLPLAFTEGFSPRPKVSFGLALSVGHESDAEYLDVELTEPVDTVTLPDRLTPALPEGVAATGAVRLVERAPALQESITEVHYRVATVDGHGRPVPDDVLDVAATKALASDELSVARIRKGKESVDDIRPALRSIEVGRARPRPPDPTPRCPAA